MSENLPNDPKGDSFLDKIQKFLLIVTKTGVILTACGAFVVAVATALVMHKPQTKNFIRAFGELVEVLVLDAQKKNASGEVPSSSEISEQEELVAASSKKHRRKARPGRKYQRLKEATPVLSILKQILILREKKEYIAHVHEDNNGLWIQDVLPGSDSTTVKVYKPGMDLEPYHEYYYERRIRDGEQLRALGLKSGMTHQQITGLNSRIKDSNYVLADITKIILKARTVYFFEDGDNLEYIAKKYHTTPEAVLRANGISVDELCDGKRLYIPYPGV